MEKFFTFDVNDKEKESLKKIVGHLEVEKYKYFFSGSSIVKGSNPEDIDVFVLDLDQKLSKSFHGLATWEEGGSDIPGHRSEFHSYRQTGDVKLVKEKRPINIVCVHTEELFKSTYESTLILQSAQLKRKEDRAALFDLVRRGKLTKDETDLFVALTLGDTKEIDRARKVVEETYLIW